jgi:long-chain fatty acid transport protein
MRGWKLLSVLLVLLLTASTSFAAGFRLPEAGAKAMGMGFAFTAQADDPSAIYFNPAGLTQLKGHNIMVGVTYVRENGGEFTGTTPLTGGATVSETQKSLDFFIPNLYYTYTTPNGYVAYGVGVFSPFGLGQEYENPSTSIFRNQITKIDLQTIVVNPTIAFKVNEYLNVGFGIDWMYAKAKLNKTPVNVGIGDNTAGGNNNLYQSALEADGSAWGYNFGAQLIPSNNIKVGFNFRSPFSMKLKDGDVDLSGISTAGRTALGGFSVSQAFFLGATSYHTEGSTVINMPATAALGVAYTYEKLTVEVDADWTFWSSFSNLAINIAGPKPPVLVSTDTPKKWKDVCAVRVGLEYRVTDPLALRVGFVYDPTPVPADTIGPELPDSNRMNYMVGAGYKIGRVTIDVAGMYIDKKDRTVNNQSVPPISAGGTPGTGFNGTWTGNAWLAGLDVGVKF